MLTDVTHVNQSSLGPQWVPGGEGPKLCRTSLVQMSHPPRAPELSRGHTHKPATFLCVTSNTYLGQIITYPEENESSEVSVVIVSGRLWFICSN